MVLNSVVLPTPLGPMMPTMPLRGSENDRLSISSRSPKPLLRLLRLDHRAAQARARRDLDLLEVQLAGLLRLAGHLVVPVQAGLGLGLPGLGVGADPLQLLGEALLHLGVAAALDGQPGGLLLQVGGVVALVPIGPAAVQLQDPAGHVVEEVPVVGDRHDGAGVLRQVLLQPGDALRVQVVGGLVEQQQVGRLQQQLAERDPAALTTGELGHVGVRRRAAQRVHGQFELGVDVPGVERGRAPPGACPSPPSARRSSRSPSARRSC